MRVRRAFSPQPPTHAAPTVLQMMWRRGILGCRVAAYHAACYVLSLHPSGLRFLLAWLRAVRPIAAVSNTFIVTLHADVREVLSRFDDFTSAEHMQSKMLAGSFLLSLDSREQHDLERGLIERAVFPDSDLDWIRTISAERCRMLIAGAKGAAGRPEIDVIGGLAEPVALEVVARYFGVPVTRDRALAIARILRRLAGIFVLEPPVSSKHWLESREGAAELRNLVTKRIRQTSQEINNNPAPPAPRDDLTTRLLKHLHQRGSDVGWFNEDWICRYVCGLAVTGNATVVRAVGQAVDQLLARPQALRQAQALAKQFAMLRLQMSSRDHDQRGGVKEIAAKQLEETRRKLQQVAYEALRFRPMLPLLVRYSPRDTVIAKGTPRARRIPAGSNVIVGLRSAMFDPTVFESPGQFKADRPLGDYLHFGHGPRLCVGRHIADIQIVEVLSSLMALPGLRRAPGRRGRLRYDGFAVDTLHLTFEPTHVDANGRDAA